MALVFKFTFWLAAFFAGYTYFGYPAWLFARSRWRSRPCKKAAILPAVSIVIALRNEIENIRAKIEMLHALDYPREKYEIVLVSDGSTDGTNEFLRALRSSCMKTVLLAASSGKASALNAGIREATGEIVVFMDARQAIALDCVKQLASCFADPEVGCASGELIIGEHAGRQTEATGLYWRLEKQIRKLESQTGSVVGATGALYAARRELIPTLPEGTVLDDVYIPMHVARAGRRVVFEPAALAWDKPSQSALHEWRRKVRTLMGNYQLLQLAPWLLTSENPIRFQYFSHKLCRLFVPFALIALLASSAMVPGLLFRSLLAGQILFYLVAVTAPFTRWRLARVAFTFVLLNSAAAAAFAKFATGRRVAWGR